MIDESQFDNLDRRLVILEDRQQAAQDRQQSTDEAVRHIEAELSRNTAATQAVKSDTEEVIALLKGSKVVAHALKWLVGIAAACATIWATLKGGGR